MKKKLLLLFAISFIVISSDYGQETPSEKGQKAINSDVIKAQLGFLASDWTEGRKAGEKGEMLSSDYIASMLKLYGVKPGGDTQFLRNQINNQVTSERSYFQNFVLIKTTPGEESVMKLKSITVQTTRTSNYTNNIDFYFRSVSGAEIEAPVVFVGYGFKNDKLKYNDFSKIDVKGKFILKITGTPLFARLQLSASELWASEREIETIAKAAGAAGIIEFNPNSVIIGSSLRKDFANLSPAESPPRPEQTQAYYLLPDKKNQDNLIRATVSGKIASEILNGTGIIIDDYIKNADSNTVNTFSPITGKFIYLKTTVINTPVTVRNVIGIIEGNNPDEIIVLGAHYDHMGMNNGYIWNGADDNGSGTVGVMTLAKAIMETGKKPEKTIIIALWTAEEEGLLGSRYFVQNLTYPLKNLKLNVNFDMISRYITDNDPKKVTMTYTNSCPVFKDITAANLTKYGIDLIVDYQPSADPPGGTDHRSFVAAGIPIMRFKPGHRLEYHTPADELSTVNWDIMEKIIRISFANVWDLANTNW